MPDPPRAIVSPNHGRWGITQMDNQTSSNPECEKVGDGVDRRGFLKCMAWAGTGLVWTAGGGILSSRTFAQGTPQKPSTFSFVQISDSHIGFGKDPYKKSVSATLEEVVKRINAAPRATRFCDPHRRPHPPRDAEGVRRCR